MRAAKLHALWCASGVPVVCQRPSPRRLDEAEDRVRAAAAAAAAAAASEASHARQAKALVKFESDAAEARARVQELEVTGQQQAASLQARMQSEGQMEETIRQLQQVLPRTCCHLVLAFD